MFSSDGHFLEKQRNRVLQAAETLTRAKTPETMVPILRDLVDAGAKTTRLKSMGELQDAQRVVTIQALYRPAIARHLLQRFEYQTDDYSLAVPLEPGQHFVHPLLPTYKAPHMTNTHAGEHSDEVIVVHPFTLRFLAFWLENIDGPLVGFKFTPTRPVEIFNSGKLSKITIEGTA